MTKDEAMKLALEWMEAIVNSNWRNWEELASPEEFERWVKVRANHSAVVLRQALEQPEQEPVAWELRKGKTDRVLIEITNNPKRAYDWKCSLEEAVPLYAAPPKREWQGLTDDEIKEIIGPWGDTPIKGYTRELFDKIEAKLKEKNT